MVEIVITLIWVGFFSFVLIYYKKDFGKLLDRLESFVFEGKKRKLFAVLRVKESEARKNAQAETNQFKADTQKYLQLISEAFKTRFPPVEKTGATDDHLQIDLFPELKNFIAESYKDLITHPPSGQVADHIKELRLELGDTLDSWEDAANMSVKKNDEKD